MRMKGVPARVAATLRELAAALDRILGPKLFGIYLYGSLTQRAFDAAHSDLDLLVVVQRDLSDAQFRRLQAWLAEAAGGDPWMRRLQMQILVRGRLLREDPRGALYQFGALTRSGSDGNPIIWLNVLASGVAVAGPPPESFLPPITTSMVFTALVRELEYLRAEVASPESPWRDQRFYRRYAVLTLCRILYTHRTGKVGSKPQAARWALRFLPPRWHSLIWSATTGPPHERRPVPLPRIARFIEFVGARLTQPNIGCSGRALDQRGYKRCELDFSSRPDAYRARNSRALGTKSA
jgi:predicted nucleotidyltransferase